MLDIRVHMMGFWLMLQDDEGQYINLGHALIFEGSMLVYDLQHDIAQWVPVWGVSASLTMMELRVANDLSNMVPSPYSEFEPVRLPAPEIIKGVLAGAESDMDSLGVEDSGDEWDKTEVGIWSCCPTPTTKVGPTWVEVHTTAQEQEMLKKQDPTWEDIVSRQLPRGMEEEDWGREKAVSPWWSPSSKMPHSGGNEPGRSDGRIGGTRNYGTICGGGTTSGTCGWSHRGPWKPRCGANSCGRGRFIISISLSACNFIKEKWMPMCEDSFKNWMPMCENSPKNTTLKFAHFIKCPCANNALHFLTACKHAFLTSALAWRIMSVKILY